MVQDGFRDILHEVNGRIIQARAGLRIEDAKDANVDALRGLNWYTRVEPIPGPALAEALFSEDDVLRKVANDGDGEPSSGRWFGCRVRPLRGKNVLAYSRGPRDGSSTEPESL